MPIISITSDPATLTLTAVGEYPVSVDRLWDAYADPRQLERFWGPPSWPATFTRHDMAVGGASLYTMTGPDGERSSGYWHFQRVDHGKGFEVLDGFTDEQGEPNAEMPSMRMVFTFEATEDGARMTCVTTFPSVEAMEQLVGMGMVEGVREAMGQIDDVVTDLAAFAAGRGTEPVLLSDTVVRITRVIRGSVEQVWRAHHEAELLQRWLLGPDGWRMPVCEVGTEVGDTYRYEWESADGEQRFGFEGEVLESAPPHRAVTTERMIDSDGPSTTNEMTLTPVTGGTLLTIVITYPTAELRAQVLEMGMADGMEASYARLEDALGV